MNKKDYVNRIREIDSLYIYGALFVVMGFLVYVFDSKEYLDSEFMSNVVEVLEPWMMYMLYGIGAVISSYAIYKNHHYKFLFKLKYLRKDWMILYILFALLLTFAISIIDPIIGTYVLTTFLVGSLVYLIIKLKRYVYIELGITAALLLIEVTMFYENVPNYFNFILGVNMIVFMLVFLGLLGYTMYKLIKKKSNIDLNISLLDFLVVILLIALYVSSLFVSKSGHMVDGEMQYVESVKVTAKYTLYLLAVVAYSTFMIYRVKNIQMKRGLKDE